MPSSDLSPKQLHQQNLLAVRIARLQHARVALEDLIREVPSRYDVPAPMRLALRDFTLELDRLERESKMAGRQP